MIDRSDIEQIMNAAKIVDVVSDFVSLKKRGTNYIGRCPFHNEKTPSFNVSPSKEIFKCFGCGKAGNAVTFVMEHESLSYPDALRYLAKKYHIEIHERELSAEEIAAQSERESLFVLNAYAKDYFVNTLHNHVEGTSVGMAYFRERGFTDATIRKFELGYSLDERNALAEAAKRSGYKAEYLAKTGLCIEHDDKTLTDRFRGRVMFPVHSLSGKIVAFGGRVLRTNDKTAKYLNSPESEIYHKSNELYGIYFAKQSIVRNDCCYLVEGYTDVISMHQSGIENVVASSGTSLTVGQIRLIKRFTNNIVVLYDGDAAGIKASIRGIDLLLGEGLNVKVLLLPDGEDPDSFAKSQNASDFVRYIDENKTDFISFKTNLLMKEAEKDPIKRSSMISDVIRSIAIIPDAVTRSVYIRDCARRLDTNEEIIYSEIAKINRQKDFEKRKKNIDELYQKEREAQEQQTSLAAQTNAQKSFLSGINPDEKLDRQARNILRSLLLDGKMKIGIDAETGEDVLAAQFILFQLKEDNIAFRNAVYQKILHEFELHAAELPEWNVERHFLNNTDVEICRTAIDLIANQYQLSSLYAKTEDEKESAERIFGEAKRLVFEYKNELISLKIKELTDKIRQAEQNRNQEEIGRLLKEFESAQNIKKRLSKELGEQVIVPSV